MSNDPLYHAQPETIPTYCDVCHGVLPGMIGIPGEWDCRCDGDDEDPLLDSKIEDYLMEKHERKQR